MPSSSRAPAIEYEWTNDPEEAEVKRLATIKHTAERNALKTVGKDLDMAEWPSYRLEDTAIYKSDGTLGNLLNAELEGPFVVRGKLVLLDEQFEDLRKPKYNNTYVELKTDAFSIGSAPITIWAHGNLKYFEIQPARRYKDIHRDMIEATSIYFHLVDILEPVLLNKTDLPLEQVLFQYAYVNGGGLNLGSCVARMKKHGLFLLSQMKKKEGFDWTTTAFFKWLSYECSDIYTTLMMKSGQEIVETPVAVHLPPREPSASDSALEFFIPKKAILAEKPVPKNKQRQSSLALCADARELTVSPKPRGRPRGSTSYRRSLTADTPGPSQVQTGAATPQSSYKYTGSIVLPSDYDMNTNLGLILSLICRAVNHDLTMPANSRSLPEQLTIGKIVSALYILHKIKSNALPKITDHNFANAIFGYHASELIRSLDASWKPTKFYQDLLKLADTQVNWTDQQKQANRWPEISNFVIVRRDSKKSITDWAPPRNQQRPTVTAAGSPARAGHSRSSSKMMPPQPQPGRRSGKEAGLRLATPLKRDSEAVSPSTTPEVEDRQPKKRRRDVTPPEMGPDSEEEEEELVDLPLRTLHPVDEDFSTSADAEDDIIDEAEEPMVPMATPARPQELSVLITPMKREGCFVSGPMGSWVCSHCSYPVYDPETEEGIARARKHMLDEAARIAREELIETEAMKTRLPNSHLLDLIRERGRLARLRDEESRIVNGKVAPEPIRRLKV